MFATGLTVSLGHCLAMCGPLQALFAGGRAAAGDRGVRLAGSLGLYHLGRILAYVLLGGAFGLAGSGLRLAAQPVVWQGAVSIWAGALLAAGAVALALGRDWMTSGTIARKFTGPIIRLLHRGGTARHPLARVRLGLLNGFLPCGPVFALALTAATASADVRVGMLLMAAYGLGTLPVLVVFGLVSGRLSPLLVRRVGSLLWAVLLLAGVQLALRGLAVLGLIPHFSIGIVVFW